MEVKHVNKGELVMNTVFIVSHTFILYVCKLGLVLTQSFIKYEKE